MRTVNSIIFFFTFVFFDVKEIKAQRDTTNILLPQIELSGFADVFLFV